MEVERSLWDRDQLIVDVDLDYENFDHPEVAWLDPHRVFELQEPVIEATLQLLGHAGIHPLTLLSVAAASIWCGGSVELRLDSTAWSTSAGCR